MHHATICYPLKDDQVLQGMKKRGFGQGKWNGYGGKKDPGETIEETAIRELQEEAGITTQTQHLEKVAEIDFSFPEISQEKDWDQKVHVYLVRSWEGEPKETEEMRPQWFAKNKLPLDAMWVSDTHWLPPVLEGRKVKAQIVFGERGEEILEKNISYVESF